MYHAALFLLADLEDILGGIIPFLVFIFWIVGQFLMKKGAAQAPKPGAPKPGPQPPREAVPDKLTSEIEKFLRRAAQKQAGQQPADVEGEKHSSGIHPVGMQTLHSQQHPGGIDHPS